MEIVSLVVGVVVGGVLVTVVPKVASFFKKQVTSVEAKASSAVSSVEKKL